MVAAKTLLAFAVLTLATSPAFATGGTTAQPLIADPALRSSIREELSLSLTDSALTARNLRQISSLTVRRKGIQSLSGLERCVSLVRLDLTDNNIKDLRPLAGLTRLQNLNLSGNQIDDLTPLAGLQLLTYLDLSRNAITDVSPLANLRYLGSLDLAGNQILQLGPLGNLHTLWALDLSGNQIVNLEPLAGLNELVLLELQSNRISDISPLSRLFALRSLSLDHNRITDIQPLVALAKQLRPEGGERYWRVSLDGNPLPPDDLDLTRLRRYSLYVSTGSEKDVALSDDQHVASLGTARMKSNAQTSGPDAGSTEGKGESAYN